MHWDNRVRDRFAGVVQDIRHGARQLRREPGSTLVAMLTIALGIGATVTLFSVADGVLLRPLPWPEADRLVRVEERRGGLRGRTPWTVTNGTYHAWSEAASHRRGIGAWRSTRQTLQNAGDPERVSVTAATPRLFSLLRARPEAGRLFIEEDAMPGERGKGHSVVRLVAAALRRRPLRHWPDHSARRNDLRHRRRHAA